ncbi:hypothetical protein EES37_17010 [Streptomyces sp. ADI91-18]|nr:hypothetical protein EES37_17010 [Streptomyces sp. ADI91-18]
METVVLIVAIVLAIGIGTYWIHLLNAQHDARIEAYRFSEPLPKPPGLPQSTSRRAQHTDTGRRAPPLLTPAMSTRTNLEAGCDRPPQAPHRT